MANHKTPDRPEILRALEGQTGEDMRRSETLGVPHRYVAMPIRQGGQVVGAVRVSLPVVAISEGEAVIQQTILWTVVMGMVVFALVGALVNWIWYRSLRGEAGAAAAEKEV